MKELLEKINEIFDNSIESANEQTSLELKILKGNINTLFSEAMNSNSDNTSKKKILVVDDSSIIRNYIEKACASKYDVVMASGGNDAINLLSKDNFDLLLLDLMMPSVDGFAVLDYLKNNNNMVPTIIISGDTTKETIDRAFKYNVVDMVEKPFSEKNIIEKIDRVLE